MTQRYTARYGWQFGFGWLLPFLLRSQSLASLERWLAYLPRVISALLLSLIAFLIAVGLGFAVKQSTRLLVRVVCPSPLLSQEDGAFTKETTQDGFVIEPVTLAEPAKLPSTPLLAFIWRVSKAMTYGLYGIVFLVFLPVILQALALSARWVDPILMVIPQIVVSVIVFAIAWLLATLLRFLVRKVTSLLVPAVAVASQSQKADEIRVEAEKRETSQPLLDDFSEDSFSPTASDTQAKITTFRVSELIATGLYWLVLLLALIPILGILGIL